MSSLDIHPIFKIYKQLMCIPFNIKKMNRPQKWVEDLNIHFSKEDIYFDQKYKKRYSIPLIIRRVKIKNYDEVLYQSE